MFRSYPRNRASSTPTAAFPLGPRGLPYGRGGLRRKCGHSDRRVVPTFTRNHVDFHGGTEVCTSQARRSPFLGGIVGGHHNGITDESAYAVEEANGLDGHIS